MLDSQLRPRTGIRRIKPHMLADDPAKYPPAAIALNSNESLLGPSLAAVDAARAACSGLERYCENPAAAVAPALAAHHGLEPERIAIGNGSDALLAALARIYLDAGSELIRSCNGYLKTPNYAYANGAEAISVPDNEFTASVDAMLDAVSDNTRMVYVANPENPAGSWLGGDEIRRLHAGLPEHVLLVLDCAYAEYVDANDYDPGHRLAREAGNVAVTHTFSKAYGLAGARVGWLYADPAIVDLVNRVGLTFPVATPSLAAVVAALDDRQHLRRVAATNARLRARFAERMRDLGLRVYPSQTNFVLLGFADPDRSAASCAEFLRRRGILVRRFASPAYRDCIRVTIGFDNDMRIASRAIAEFIGAPH